VGGGATGAGTAVDAAARGLKVAMVERDDWSSGTLFAQIKHDCTEQYINVIRYLVKVD